MEKKELGKIQSVNFGYHEYLFGLNLILGGEGWGVSTSCCYNPSYKGSEGNDEYIIEMINRVQKLLKDAKVDTVDKLLNKPIECTFDGNLLVEFRILTEVI